MDQSNGITLTQGTKRITDQIIRCDNNCQYQLYEECKAKVGECYVDEEFKPNEFSISRTPETYKKALACVWLRASEIFGKCSVFCHGVTPNDIKQGQLSDCYFLSTLSALAEQPQELIKRLFISDKYTKQGIYAVWLCHDAEWKQVVIDDHFPCSTKSKKPMFSKANENELWVLILEKAYAKLFGTYDKIELGFSACAFRDLTGAPSITYKKKNETPEEGEHFFALIKEGLEKQYVITTSSDSSTEGLEHQSGEGIVAQHCYSILDGQIIQDADGQEVHILKMRNPWGYKEWNGDWSDASEKWTAELRAKLKVEKADDGIFWISSKDFIKQFDSIVIGYLHADYLYTSHRFLIDNSEQNTRRVTVINNKHASNHCFITISQSDKRTYLKEPGNFKYSLIKMIVCQFNSEGKQVIKYVANKFQDGRDVYVECTLEAGDYSVYLETDWEQNLNRKLVISTYSQHTVKINEIEDQHISYDLVLSQSIKSHSFAGLVNKIQEYKENLRRQSNSVGGFIYFHYINGSESSLKEEFHLKNYKNVVVCSPFTETDLNTIECPANSEQLLFFKIVHAGEYSYSNSTKYWIH